MSGLGTSVQEFEINYIPAALPSSQAALASPPATIGGDIPGNPLLPLWLPRPISGLTGATSPKSETGATGGGAGSRKNGDSISGEPPTLLPPAEDPDAATSHGPTGAPRKGRGLQRKGPNPALRGGGGGGVRDSSVDTASW